jgi:hypothetical protein
MNFGILKIIHHTNVGASSLKAKPSYFSTHTTWVTLPMSFGWGEGGGETLVIPLEVGKYISHIYIGNKI